MLRFSSEMAQGVVLRWALTLLSPYSSPRIRSQYTEETCHPFDNLVSNMILLVETQPLKSDKREDVGSKPTYSAMRPNVKGVNIAVSLRALSRGPMYIKDLP
ncbi:hypothetical protein TWF225_011319 [Orbilia oligospora]|nr:hypothetical protein TWF225_011319 [Orbilia oligospora]KAF3244965.1 hypothetical protein TWF217_010587 [Orbilia oligospora]KAF3265904.1 hypothetical protein TWF128_011484 [Orbilia oligospora]